MEVPSQDRPSAGTLPKYFPVSKHPRVTSNRNRSAFTQRSYGNLPGIEGIIRAAQANGRASMLTTIDGTWHAIVADYDRRHDVVSVNVVPLGKEAPLIAADPQWMAKLDRLLSGYQFFRDAHRLVACELHDGLMQHLVAARLKLEQHECQAGKDSELVSQASEELATAIEEVRRLLSSVEAHETVRKGLIPAIRELISHLERTRGIKVLFQHKNVPDHLPPLYSANLYRIVQESLNNVAKHANTDRAIVRLLTVANCLQLEIRDFGCGFDTRTARSGFGLRSITTRAQHLGGWASIDSTPNKGTRVFVSIPLERYHD